MCPGRFLYSAVNNSANKTKTYSTMMKQDIKNKEIQGNREYVSPSVKVIEVTAQRIICTSSDAFGIKPDTGYTEEAW